MKKTLTLLSVCTLLTVSGQHKQKNVQATMPAQKTQVAPPSNMYTFSTFTAPYVNITGTSVSNGEKWDDLVDTIPVGFNIKLYNALNDTIQMFGGSGVTFDDFINGNYLTGAMPMFEDLCDRAYDPNADTEGDPGGISNISYSTTGTAGSRICKIQVNNAGFYAENNANATSVSSVNFQVWLYETSHNIEFRFGSVNIINPSLNLNNATGFICGLTDSLDWNTALSIRANMLNGVYSNPTMVGPNATFNDVITGNIDNGRVYKFTRASLPTILLNNTLPTAIALYPNPAKDKLFISNVPASPGATISIYDISGKCVLSEILSKAINISSVSKGIYTVKINDVTGAAVLVSKLIISE